MAKWKYEIKPTNTKSKEAPIDDFFTRSSEANSLIREAIQNSLDEQINSEKPVIVKITINNKAAKLPSEQVLKWFAPEGIDHFESDSSGLRNKPDFKEDCSYLIYEDFNTHGLTGNVLQHTKIKDKPNSFYGFYRQEGQTEKLKGLGSNGVGKIVFPMSSKVRTMFGFTTRNDDKKTYLMGVSSLSYHNIDDDIYLGDGYYADFYDPDDKSKDFQVPDDVDQDAYKGFSLPIDETEILEKFRQTFNLKRDGETGLSVVVPWLDESIDYDGILKSVIEEYYPAVMSGALIVEIFDSKGDYQVIDDETITELTIDNIDISDDIKTKILLALAYYTSPGLNNNPGADGSICLPKISKITHKWSDKLFPEDLITQIKDDLEPKDSVVMIKVPVKIHPKNNDDRPQNSFFTLLLKKIDYALKPTFIRDQLIISHAVRAKVNGYLAMVFVQDKPLDNFTRNAENPSHSSWSVQAKNFRYKYKSGGELLVFIKNSPQQIISRLAIEDEKPDSSVLANTFNIQRPGVEPIKDPNNEVKPPPPPPPPPPRPVYFNEQQTSNGFKVTGGKDLTSKRKFQVHIGYRSAASNKIKWHEEDFKLEEMDIVDEYITNLSFISNTITFYADSKNFSINVSGFDKNRDLIVQPRSFNEENEDA